MHVRIFGARAEVFRKERSGPEELQELSDTVSAAGTALHSVISLASFLCFTHPILSRTSSLLLPRPATTFRALLALRSRHARNTALLLPLVANTRRNTGDRPYPFLKTARFRYDRNLTSIFMAEHWTKWFRYQFWWERDQQGSISLFSFSGREDENGHIGKKQVKTEDYHRIGGWLPEFVTRPPLLWDNRSAIYTVCGAASVPDFLNLQENICIEPWDTPARPEDVLGQSKTAALNTMMDWLFRPTAQSAYQAAKNADLSLQDQDRHRMLCNRL